MGMHVKGVMAILENLYGESPFYFKSQINHAVEEYNNLLGDGNDTITKENSSTIKVSININTGDRSKNTKLKNYIKSI